jgi:hypothetical protein
MFEFCHRWKRTFGCTATLLTCVALACWANTLIRSVGVRLSMCLFEFEFGLLDQVSL